ncbi:hypothetical protein F5Y02DRAFT_399791 [Annulohypoxylon stygium]|nr:hypothetical protein F5Y02DRAFT_399791 [Annulohypoxylon stygium]
MTSLYDLTVPVLTKILRTELEILKDAEKYAKENGKSVEELLKARLIPDMYSASVQIGITVMFTKKILQILLGNKFEADMKEVPLAESYAQLNDALNDLATVKPETLNGREAEIVEFPVGKKSVKAPAVEFIQRSVMSQMYFHMNILYAVLRKEGVPLGKPLYLTHYLEGWTLE